MATNEIIKRASINEQEAESEYRTSISILQLERDAKKELYDSIDLNKFVEIPQFKSIEADIEILQKSPKLKGLVLLGEHGTGKSSTIKVILKKKKLDFEYLKNFSTALSLYEWAYQNKNKWCILDDCDNLLGDNRCIALLKSLTDEQGYVAYESTTDKLKVPRAFNFKGKVILLTNHLPDSSRLESLKDRLLVREIKLSLAERKAMIKPIIIANYSELPIVDEVEKFILENLNESVPFSFRTILKVMEIRQYGGENWKQLAKEELKASETLLLIKELMTKHRNVNAQIEEFKARSGLGRSSFFVYKKKLLDLA